MKKLPTSTRRQRADKNTGNMYTPGPETKGDIQGEQANTITLTQGNVAQGHRQNKTGSDYRT